MEKNRRVTKKKFFDKASIKESKLGIKFTLGLNWAKK